MWCWGGPAESKTMTSCPVLSCPVFRHFLVIYPIPFLLSSFLLSLSFNYLSTISYHTIPYLYLTCVRPQNTPRTTYSLSARPVLSHLTDHPQTARTKRVALPHIPLGTLCLIAKRFSSLPLHPSQQLPALTPKRPRSPACRVRTSKRRCSFFRLALLDPALAG